MPDQSLCDTPVREAFTVGAAPARGLRLRWDLIAIARRVLAARDGLDPVAAASLLPAGVRPGPDALPVSDLTRTVVHFLKEEGGATVVEHAVTLALIAVMSVAAIATLGSNVDSTVAAVVPDSWSG